MWRYEVLPQNLIEYSVINTLLHIGSNDLQASDNMHRLTHPLNFATRHTWLCS
jgi:hypothetical protein